MYAKAIGKCMPFDTKIFHQIHKCSALDRSQCWKWSVFRRFFTLKNPTIQNALTLTGYIEFGIEFIYMADSVTFFDAIHFKGNNLTGAHSTIFWWMMIMIFLRFSFAFQTKSNIHIQIRTNLTHTHPLGLWPPPMPALFISFHRLSLSCGVSFLCVFPHLYVVHIILFLRTIYLFSILGCRLNSWSWHCRAKMCTVTDGHRQWRKRRKMGTHAQWASRYSRYKRKSSIKNATVYFSLLCEWFFGILFNSLFIARYICKSLLSRQWWPNSIRQETNLADDTHTRTHHTMGHFRSVRMIKKKPSASGKKYFIELLLCVVERKGVGIWNCPISHIIVMKGRNG